MISIRLEAPTARRCPPARPGQYLTLRVQHEAGEPLLRNYSLSGPPDAGYYRITVKREHDGAASRYLHTRSPSATRSTSPLPRHLRPRPDARAGPAHQRRDRRHPGPGDAPRARDRARPRCGGCTARAIAARHAFAEEAGLLAALPHASPRVSTAAGTRTRARLRPAGRLTAASPAVRRRTPTTTCAARRSSWRHRRRAGGDGVAPERVALHRGFGAAPGLRRIAEPRTHAPPPRAPGNGPTSRSAQDLAVPGTTAPACSTRRGVRRRASVPHRRLPQLRDHLIAGSVNYSAGDSGRPSRPRERARLLLHGPRQRGAELGEAGELCAAPGGPALLGRQKKHRVRSDTFTRRAGSPASLTWTRREQEHRHGAPGKDEGQALRPSSIRPEIMSTDRDDRHRKGGDARPPAADSCAVCRCAGATPRSALPESST